MDIYTCLANPHPSVVSHRFHSFLEVFGDKTNIPEDTQGRQMLLADTGRVPAAPSRSSRGGQRSLWLPGAGQGLAEPLGVSLLPRWNKATVPGAGTHTTPQPGDLYQGQPSFGAKHS